MPIINFYKNPKVIFIAITTIALVFYYFSLTGPLFLPVFSTAITSSEGHLLGATIADDGQWRFPPSGTIPQKFEKALLAFEDKYFYYHPGFNPLSIIKAAYYNIKAGKTISGGSTISMQLIRMSRQQKNRNLKEKLIEILLATRLEFRYSKKEILELYANHAPFGGNTVGLAAASWRYYQRPPDQLSWSETATLAVLPNSPALIYPGKNQYKLKIKRDKLLLKLLLDKTIDSLSYQLACAEPLPGKPQPLPNKARHLLSTASKQGLKGQNIHSTLQINLQENVNTIVDRHHNRLKGNGIFNAAVLVAHVSSGKILAYVGNTATEKNQDHGNEVDIIRSKRSTGSILKPFLYAAMLHEGSLLPDMLVADVPTFMKGFSPQNFNKTFDGAVPASRALARSLNIPAVLMLHEYGVEKLHFLLQNMGMQSINQAPSHYGLSLILGGAEGSLWDVAGMYAGMGRTLNNYYKYNLKYKTSDFHPLIFQAPDTSHNTTQKKEAFNAHSLLNAAAIWHTFEAMQEVYRPDNEANWQMFSSSRKIAWKTGTSFGFRDGWAIGVTPEYVVAVWIGNADGEGRPGLIGVETAGPLMFDIFAALPQTSWFRMPVEDMVTTEICNQSGHKAATICDQVTSKQIPAKGIASPVCPYHRLISLDLTGNFRVSGDCQSVYDMQQQPWFVLPPVQEWFFKSKNAGYKVLPPFKTGCGSNQPKSDMAIIYPKNKARIYVPRDLDGLMGKAVFEVAHRLPDTEIFWHLDEKYMGSTKRLHQMGFSPTEGSHTLTLIDAYGETIVREFEVIAK